MQMQSVCKVIRQVSAEYLAVIYGQYKQGLSVPAQEGVVWAQAPVSHPLPGVGVVREAGEQLSPPS